MNYQFIIDLSEKQYISFLKSKTFTSYKHEGLWSIASDVEEIFYIGVKDKRKIVAVAKIEVIRHKKDIFFNVPGGYLLDYTDKELLHFFAKHLYLLAKERRAYKISLDFMAEEDDIILRNFKELDYTVSAKPEVYEGIALKVNRKTFTLKHFKNILGTQNVEKDGLFFEVINKKAQIKKLYDTLDNWSYNAKHDFNRLVKKYKDNINVIVEKIDLIFYLNYLRENYARENDIVTIEELIEECGDDYVLGFAVIVFPDNKETAFCLEMRQQGSFQQLNSNNQLILETIRTSLERKYRSVIYQDQVPFKDFNYTNYSYELGVRRWKAFLHKVIK